MPSLLHLCCCSSSSSSSIHPHRIFHRHLHRHPTNLFIVAKSSSIPSRPVLRLTASPKPCPIVVGWPCVARSAPADLIASPASQVSLVYKQKKPPPTIASPYPWTFDWGIGEQELEPCSVACGGHGVGFVSVGVTVLLD